MFFKFIQPASSAKNNTEDDNDDEEPGNLTKDIADAIKNGNNVVTFFCKYTKREAPVVDAQQSLD